MEVGEYFWHSSIFWNTYKNIIKLVYSAIFETSSVLWVVWLDTANFEKEMDREGIGKNHFKLFSKFWDKM